MSFADITNIEETANAKDNISFGERILIALDQQRRSKTWLAEKIGISKQAINYLIKHSSTPKYVNEIAAALEVNPQWLLFGNSSQQLFSEKEAGILRIPLLSLNEISDYLNHNGRTNEFTYIAANDSASETCFATILDNKSMEPLFNEGTLLIFNPDLKPKNGDYIIFSNNKDILFRHYFIEGNEIYLKAVDVMYKTFKSDNIHVLGVLIESRSQFR